jgi:hypothetical protein
MALGHRPLASAALASSGGWISDWFEVRLTSISDPVSSVGHTTKIRMQAVSFDLRFDYLLVQNTTVLDSWSEHVTAAAGVVERSRVHSGTVADSITDYTNLRIRGRARAA